MPVLQNQLAAPGVQLLVLAVARAFDQWPCLQMIEEVCFRPPIAIWGLLVARVGFRHRAPGARPPLGAGGAPALLAGSVGRK